MNKVEQSLFNRARRMVLVLLAVVALGCLGVAALAPTHPEIAREKPQTATQAQDAEIEGLKRSVRFLQQKSSMLAAALASSPRANEAQAPDEELKPPPAVKESRTPAELEQEQTTEMEALLASEDDGSRDNLIATQKLQAELSALPLDGTRIIDVTCSRSLCRTMLERESSAAPLDMNSIIEGSPTVRQQSRFTYADEGLSKRITIYSAREGHHLNPPATE